MTKRVLFDSHVHIYSCFEKGKFIYNSFKNFADNHRQIDNSSNFISFMFITDGYEKGYQSFKELCGTEVKHKDETFFLHSTAPDKYIEINTDESKVYLIPGNQFITKENLEVLVVGKSINNYSSTDVNSTISMFLDEFLVIIPWGFGKWLGDRGVVISSLIENNDIHFLGDNGGICSIVKFPKQFQEAKKKQIPILPGSDQLPIKYEVKRPGSFGFYTSSFELDLENPISSIKSHLTNDHTVIKPYGNRVYFPKFLFNQIYMQYLKSVKR